MKEKLISETIGKALIIEEPKTPKLYFSPKVHKKDIPGRPVVNSINSHSSTISRFVDIHLQPLVKSLKAYIKDTTDFINKIEELKNIPDNAILVTMDIKALYTNIPHTEGINAVAKCLEKTNIDASTRVILKFLSLILHLNNFSFNGKHYEQNKGCTMGSKCSPTYANIFMDDFENKHILPRIENKTLCYYRFIDDIFMIWTQSVTELKELFEELNNVHETIKFECKHSAKEIPFLDTVIFKNQHKGLSTKLYTKPTDRASYLHKTSYHPKSLKDSIPFGQALRVKRICSEKSDCEEGLKSLKEKFIQRGYEGKDIENQFGKLTKITRTELLTRTQRTRSSRIPLCITYNRTLPNIKSAIDNNWNLLQINNNLAKTFQQKPVTCYKRNKNLRDLIGQNQLRNNKLILPGNKILQGYSQACLSKANNLCCQQVISTQTFRSDTTGKEFYIRHKLKCHSKYIIYLGFCVLCKKHQYVGKAESTFNIRLNNHRKDANKEKSIPFDEHFRCANHNFTKHARFILIEQIKDMTKSKEAIRKILEDREDFWMKKLETITPNGLNIQLNQRKTRTNP